MFDTVRLRFATFIPEGERALIREALLHGPSESQRFLCDQSGAKTFYRVEIPTRSLFVKGRVFSAWSRRLGRTFWKTKEEEEFRNYMNLRTRGIPCPDPLGTAREYDGLFIRRSFLFLEYVPNAFPLRLLLIKGGPSTGQVLDNLVAFLKLLQEKGVIHEDLQWNNLLVSPTPSGPKFFLVDALHIHWVQAPQDKTFRRTLAWFVHFLISGKAPQEVIEGFLHRMDRLGLKGPKEHRCLLEEARRMGGKAHERRKLPPV